MRSGTIIADATPARVHGALHRQLRLVLFVLLVRLHYFTAEDDEWVTAPTADSPCETAFSLPPKTHQEYFQWACEGERKQGALEHGEGEKKQVPPQVWPLFDDEFDDLIFAVLVL